MRSSIIRELCETLVSAGRRDAIKNMAHECTIATTPAQVATVRKAVAAIAKGLGQKPASDLTTFKDVADQWITGELRKKHPDHVRRKKDFKIEYGRLKRSIYPHIEDVPIAAFEKAPLIW